MVGSTSWRGAGRGGHGWKPRASAGAWQSPWDGGRDRSCYGRTQREGDAALPGTIKTAAEVSEAGGRGVAVACDHGDDASVARLFERVADEQDGRLDVLLNNATFLHDELTSPKPFWKSRWDFTIASSMSACGHHTSPAGTRPS
ncbi:SDR family oxidoreductase [Sphingomonas sp. MMS24-JH45]